VAGARAHRTITFAALLLAAAVATISRPALCQSPLTTRINLTPSGAQANLPSGDPRITGNGRFIVYESSATNLVPSDTNFAEDVFVYDALTGTTVRASVDSTGTQANGNSELPTVSNDGRFVVFQSLASNLVTGDTNGARDIFVRDMVGGTTSRISVDSAGTQSNGDSYRPRISADGRFVVFESLASNLVAGDANGVRDVFMRDLVMGTTTLVSVDSSGNQGNGSSENGSISADGRFVVFESFASNLVPNDTNGVWDVFLHDNLTGTTTRVSVSSLGTQGDQDSANAAISPSGLLVAFCSIATNLVDGDTNGVYDVFVRDLAAAKTTRISVNSHGDQANDGSFDPAISGDDRFVSFDSSATNLVDGDTNGWPDVFVRDLVSNSTVRVSVTTGGAQTVAQSSNPSISDDGRFITFISYGNLVPDDTNGASDIYVRDQSATGLTILCDPGSAGVMACPCANPPSGSGRGCNNSSATGGAALAGSGVAYLSMDSLVFATSGEKPTATSIVLQDNALIAGGLVFGQGVRCVGGSLKRLYTKSASGGSITAPQGGDPSVSARSAALGDVISAGQSRWYLVYYRDPIVLGGCASSSTFNATQTARIDWSLCRSNGHLLLARKVVIQRAVASHKRVGSLSPSARQRSSYPTSRGVPLSRRLSFFLSTRSGGSRR
jgi:Tol biopolymer transport system component